MGSGPARRIFLAAFGDPGHAFPMLALGQRLAARGHAVVFETWERWRAPVQAAGMSFLPAPEFPVFPTRERPLAPYQAAVLACERTRPRLAEAAPDVVVADVLTLAPALAAELEGVPRATLIPHLHPVTAPGHPPWSLGARPPRTRVGAALWRALAGPSQAGLRRGRDELDGARARVGLGPAERLHGGLSEALCLVATLPQLEHPRRWPAHVHVVGPLLWEPPAQPVEPPPGERPLVLVAPSTAQDPEHRLLRAALAAMAVMPVRVLATWNRRRPPGPVPVPANARLVEWLSYARTMPRCRLVVCHAGHGTAARALASGCPVVAVPAAGDMAENAARIDWAGLGVRLPWRLLSPGTLRLAIARALGDPALAARAAATRRWMEAHDPAGRAADLVEGLAGSAPPPAAGVP